MSAGPPPLLERISAEDQAALLAFVDAVVPSGCVGVWLTGSRAIGKQRADSDWDVLALHPDASNGNTKYSTAEYSGEPRLTAIGSSWLLFNLPGSTAIRVATLLIADNAGSDCASIRSGSSRAEAAARSSLAQAPRPDLVGQLSHRR
jgi:hypothetical protein